jgi:hypothetical protein
MRISGSIRLGNELGNEQRSREPWKEPENFLIRKIITSRGRTRLRRPKLIARTGVLLIESEFPLTGTFAVFGQMSLFRETWDGDS